MDTNRRWVFLAYNEAMLFEVLDKNTYSWHCFAASRKSAPDTADNTMVRGYYTPQSIPVSYIHLHLNQHLMIIIEWYKHKSYSPYYTTKCREHFVSNDDRLCNFSHDRCVCNKDFILNTKSMLSHISVPSTRSHITDITANCCLFWVSSIEQQIEFTCQKEQEFLQRCHFEGRICGKLFSNNDEGIQQIEMFLSVLSDKSQYRRPRRDYWVHCEFAWIVAHVELVGVRWCGRGLFAKWMFALGQYHVLPIPQHTSRSPYG